MRPITTRRPSPALVLAALALLVAVVGTASVATGAKTRTVVIVRKGQIAKGAVTAKSLAQGAVHAKALSAGAVGAGAIKGGAITGSAIAPDSVGAGQLAPGSVYGGALGEVTVHSAPLIDADATADLSTWTPSPPATALCAAGERVISGGVVFTSVANGRVAIVMSQPFVNGAQNGWVGSITTDSGGVAKAEVQALCLK
jgi:hypothetical protein